MVAECCRTVSAIICWVGIFLSGLNPVYPVEFLIERVITELIAYHHSQQDEGGKSNGQIGQVDQGEDLIFYDIPINAGEKMFDHRFFTSNNFQIIRSCPFFIPAYKNRNHTIKLNN